MLTIHFQIQLVGSFEYTLFEVTMIKMKHRFNLLLILIRFYQFFISPLLGDNCRFDPSCSEYARSAIRMHGNIKGLWLFIKRIIRCNPFCQGGYDPVPNTTQPEN
jgi:putative membrane protein insertion efficiency factor